MMRGFLHAFPLLALPALLCFLHTQRAAAAPSPAPPDPTELQRALVGSWAGTLEYRDFSEPATSTKRVKLPTWLVVEPAGADLRFRYIYDDGPAKTVIETVLIRIDPTAARYAIIDLTGKLEDSYAIAGLADLRQGRGTLTLTGTGTENKATVEVRTTIRIGRNILEFTRETGVSGQPLTFRHAYTLVRASPPPAITPGN
jgi:hypothetical protein